MRKYVMSGIMLVCTILMSVFLHWVFQLNFYWNNGWSWFIIGMCTAICTIIGFVEYNSWNHDGCSLPLWIFGITTAVIIVVSIVCGLINGNMVKSKSYYYAVNDMVTIVEDSDEVSAFPNLLGENNDVKNLPLIGIPEAIKKAETEMGRFPALGSQFELNVEDMTSQSIGGKLKYVIPLQPRSLFKWNKSIGNHGYFIIDRNNCEVEFVEESLKTTTRAPFGSATKRIVHSYLSSIGISGLVTDVSPEVDDDGNFHYIATVYTLDGMMSAFPVVKGVVEVDAFDLTCKFYNLDEIPEYVDRVYPEWVFEDYLNYYGNFKHGFWNSVFGQKDVLAQTADMDVLYIDGQCWYYTGFTTIGKDESSNGIIMMNSRTGEIEYHVTYGISEARAQQVAEGLVADKGYIASYPLLLKVGGAETYFMLMRDDSENLVGYSFVSYKDYTKAAVEVNLLDAQTAYITSLKTDTSSGVIDESALNTVKGVIDEVVSEVVNGTTVYYIRLTVGKTIYQMQSNLNIDIVFANAGDFVEIEYYDSGSLVESVVNIRFK